MNKKEYVSLWVKIFGEKPKIDLALMSDRQRALFNWRKIVRLITLLMYAFIWNGLFSIGWYTHFHQNNNEIINKIGNNVNTIILGIGHFSVGLGQLIFSKITSTKVHKVEQINGNNIIKKSKIGILFTILILIPIIIYFIGYIIILIKIPDKYYNSYSDGKFNKNEYKEYKKAKIQDISILKETIDSVLDIKD
ncbi:hypothetical protein [Mesoplasma melaleucae]|uniref:Uncharacterized protein n=1 Tax=Mesoplasma melaleucae TaxID=81459 RepID=A0A2K8NVE7_9MOLU|nr:hypothetical protein [Mesoplasma melaleucae]ATZ17789.1 hypothetical protein EMELA_v1c02160 [Mesoplasma melaleucae]